MPPENKKPNTSPVDDTKPQLEPPVEPFEMTGTPSASAQMPTKKSRKGLIIGAVVAAVLVLLAGAAAFAYVWYQNPDKVVGDALQNAVNSKSVTGTGELKSVTKSDDGSELELLGNFSLASDNTKLSFDADASINGAKVGMSVLSSTDTTTYVKIKNLKEIVSSILSEDAANGPFKTFIAKVGDKWVRLDSSESAEAKQFADQEKCYRKTLEEYAKSKVQREQLINAYRDNPVFTIVAKGDQVINSVDSTRYQVTPNPAKYQAFVEAVKKTEFFKAMNGCSQGSLANDLDESVKEFKKSDNSTVIEVWVSKWQHQFTQIKVTTKTATDNTTLTFKPVFDRAVRITKPTKSISFEEAYSLFMEAFFEGMGVDPTDQALQLN